jgi:hypothetical protein
MLVRVDDVAPGVGEEAADCRDQARSVGAGEEEARGRRSGVDAGIIAQDRVQQPTRMSRLVPANVQIRTRM